MSPDAYELHEGRLVQENLVISAANATWVYSGVVPQGKVWTVLAGFYKPNANENPIVYVGIAGRSTVVFPITLPAAIALGTAIPLPIFTNGQEMKLWPGEYFAANRATATAGSTMQIHLRFIESDLPFYKYSEPQKKVVSPSSHRSPWVYGSAAGFGGGSSSGSPGSSEPGGGSGGGGGGKGEPQPI